MPATVKPVAVTAESPGQQPSPEELAELVKRGRALLTAETASRGPSVEVQAVASGSPFQQRQSRGACRASKAWKRVAWSWYGIPPAFASRVTGGCVRVTNSRSCISVVPELPLVSTARDALLKLGIALKPSGLQTPIVVIADQRPVASKILIPKRQIPPATSLQIKNNDVSASITVPVQSQENCLTFIIWSY